jgi:hypothetical protein
MAGPGNTIGGDGGLTDGGDTGLTVGGGGGYAGASENESLRSDGNARVAFGDAEMSNAAADPVSSTTAKLARPVGTGPLARAAWANAIPSSRESNPTDREPGIYSRQRSTGGAR